MKVPDKEDLVNIISAHFKEEIQRKDATTLSDELLNTLVENFIKKRDKETLATDQLLNALFMVKKGSIGTKEALIDRLLNDLGQVAEDE